MVFQFAYIDPSAVSAIAVAIPAAVIAVGATVTVVVRKARKKVRQALNIDENAGKETEAAVQVVDDDDD